MKNTTNIQMNNMLQMLNNNSNTPNNPNSSNTPYVQSHHMNTNNLNKWISQTREILIKTEQRSLTARIQQWTKIINSCVNLLASKLHLSTKHVPKCKDIPISNTYLQYIMKYNISMTSNPPTNINECISHAQNWLNERRGHQY
eukprot:1009900_1